MLRGRALGLFVIWSLPSFFRLLSSTNNVCFSSPKMFVPPLSPTPPTPQRFCVLLCFFAYAVSLPQNVPIPPYHQHPSLGPCLLMIIHSVAQESRAPESLLSFGTLTQSLKFTSKEHSLCMGQAPCSLCAYNLN